MTDVKGMTEVKGMDLEMEELHMAASAYYNNASTEFKQVAREFFESMDTNQDDTVSIDEFVEFFKDYDNMDRNFFAALDRNGDGNLQFREALTVFYILIARRLLCDNCGKMILGLHFTCVQCFDRVNEQSYDLCVTCYSKGGFQHPHANFLDNFMLLGYMGRLPPPEDTNPVRIVFFFFFFTLLFLFLFWI